MEHERELIFFKHYFREFYERLNMKVQDKIDQVLFMVRIAERIPRKFFQHMKGTEGLFEIRIEYQGNIYRVFCCFDEGNVVVLFNGFQKKSQKTPRKEIEKLKELKMNILNSNENRNEGAHNNV